MLNISDKRKDIMQAAMQLIAERGFHDSPMSEIAQKAHVAAGTIYRYFENKDVLITELFYEMENKIIERLLERYPFEKTVQEKFSHVFGELYRYFINNPLYFRYMEQYFNSPYGISVHRDKLLGKTIAQDGTDTLKLIFEEGIAQQILKDLPLTVLFALSIGPLIHLMRDHTLGFLLLDESLIRQITEACWDAIKR